MSEPLHIFISYAHADESFKNELTTMLALLKRQGWVKSWDDRQIDAGSDWRADIMGGMDRCDLALLLISPAFLASEFIQSVEMTHLLARRKHNGIRVVPIILRPCLWHLDDIAQTQGLPKDGKAVITFRPDNGERDQVWTDIGMKIVGWAKEHKLVKENAQAGANITAGASAHASTAHAVTGAGEPVNENNMAWAADLVANAKKRGQTFDLAMAPAINPFNPWQPALPPHFYGREKVLRQLDAALDEKRSVSIVGDWRIGKSSLLLTWQGQVKARGRVTVFVSGEGPEAQSCGALLKAITSQNAPDGNNADACADLLANWVQNQHVPPLIVLDEADRMLLALPYRWFERLRGMIGQGRLCLLLASSRPVDMIYQDAGHGSPFMNLLQQIRLGLLDEAAAEQLFLRGQARSAILPLSPAGFRLTHEHLKLVQHWAGRHPFFMTLLAHHLWENPCHLQVTGWSLRMSATSRNDTRLLPQADGMEGASMIESMVAFRDEAESRLRELWASLRENERAGLLRVLAGQPCGIGSLKLRGLVVDTAQGEALFGDVLAAWMREMG